MSKHRHTPANYDQYGYTDPAQPYPPEKKSNKKKWFIGLGGLTVLGLAVIGFTTPTPDADDQPAPGATTTVIESVAGDPAPAPVISTPDPEPTAPAEDLAADGHTLRFEADTSDGATGMVTWAGKGGNIQQEMDAAMPWSAEDTGIDNTLDVIGANSSIMSNGSGEVTCRILWDGQVVSESTSSGQFATASCTLPIDLF